MGTLRFDDAPDVDLFAYTFSFGNGFSATLSPEEGRYGTLAWHRTRGSRSAHA